MWSTQKTMAELFDVTSATINEHLKNIFQIGELKEMSTIRNFLIVQKEGNRTISREIQDKNYISDFDKEVTNKYLDKNRNKNT